MHHGLTWWTNTSSLESFLRNKTGLANMTHWAFNYYSSKVFCSSFFNNVRCKWIWVRSVIWMPWSYREESTCLWSRIHYAHWTTSRCLEPTWLRQWNKSTWLNGPLGDISRVTRTHRGITVPRYINGSPAYKNQELRASLIADLETRTRGKGGEGEGGAAQLNGMSRTCATANKEI